MINVYVIQIVLILFFGFLFREDKKKFLIVAFIILFVVMAFRNARLIGNDSATSYYDEFLHIQKMELSWPNPGFSVVMKVLAFLNGDYQWVIVITAIFVCFAYYKLLLKHSENGFISVMWFMGMLFYTFLFSALKQAWAMAFLCFAFDAIIEKKPIRYLLFVSLAVVFHFPALIFLPAYWIFRLKINRAFPIIMFSVLVIVFIFRIQILELMISTYRDNGETEYTIEAQYTGMKFIFMILMLSYGFFQYFAKNNNIDKKNQLFSLLLYFMGIAAVIQTFCLYSNNFERLADFYYQFSILFVPLIVSNNYESNQIDLADLGTDNNTPSLSGALSKKRISNYSIEDIDINVALITVIILFCVWRYVSFTGSGADSLSPFYFFWQ